MNDAPLLALQGTALISQILILIFFGAFGYAVGYSGRFKLVFIKPGSRMHLVLGRINVAYHVIAAVIAVALPPLTGFAGAPLLAYITATLIIGSLFMYRLKPLSLHIRLFPAGGKRAKPLAEQERTRWPYALTCGIGYIVMLAYVWTLAPGYL